MSTESWVESAQHADTDFPLANIPFGVFRAEARGTRPGVAIGDCILDLAAAAEHGLLDDAHATIIHDCAGDGSLNPLLAAGRPVLSAVRERAIQLLTAGHTAERSRKISGPVSGFAQNRDFGPRR